MPYSWILRRCFLNWDCLLWESLVCVSSWHKTSQGNHYHHHPDNQPPSHHYYTPTVTTTITIIQTATITATTMFWLTLIFRVWLTHYVFTKPNLVFIQAFGHQREVVYSDSHAILVPTTFKRQVKLPAITVLRQSAGEQNTNSRSLKGKGFMLGATSCVWFLFGAGKTELFPGLVEA